MSADKDAWIGGVESAVIQQAVNATAYTRLTDLLLAGRVDVCYNLFTHSHFVRRISRNFATLTIVIIVFFPIEQ